MIRHERSFSALHHQMTGVLESAKKYYKIDVVTGEAVRQKTEGLALCKKAGIKKY